MLVSCYFLYFCWRFFFLSPPLPWPEGKSKLLPKTRLWMGSWSGRASGFCPPFSLNIYFCYFCCYRWLVCVDRHALIIIRLVNSPFFIFSLTQATTVFSFVDKKHSRCKVVWCDWEGKPSNWTGLLPSVDMVCQGLAFASPSMLHFKNP